jgi:hypothetical protein
MEDGIRPLIRTGFESTREKNETVVEANIALSWGAVLLHRVV